MPRLFLTRRLPVDAEAILAGAAELAIFAHDRPPTPDELIAGAAGADGLVVVLPTRIDDAVLTALPSVRVVANVAVGFDNVDVAAATARGVWVTNTPDVLTHATAELAWALILATARRLGEGERFVREGRWVGFSPTLMLGMELHARTLGVFGLGRIGSAVARIGAAFGMRCLATTGGSRSVGDVVDGVTLVSKETLLAESDVLSLHSPATPATRHAIGAAELAAMKRGAILVNTARGAIVDEAALADALASGHLGGAGLDVFEREPQVLPALLAQPNAVLLPHVGSATVTARTAMARLALTDAARVLRGERPAHPVNEPVQLGRKIGKKTGSPCLLKVKAIINKTMYVCLCEGVSDREVRACVRAGAGSVREVGRACGAGTGCGACHAEIREILAEAAPDERRHKALPMMPCPALPIGPHEVDARDPRRAERRAHGRADGHQPVLPAREDA